MAFDTNLTMFEKKLKILDAQIIILDCKIYPGCFLSSDSSVAIGPMEDVDGCNDWCSQTPTCRGWTFDNGTKYCWLKLTFDLYCDVAVAENYTSGTGGCSSVDFLSKQPV